MRITGDNEEGKAELDNFIDPNSRDSHPGGFTQIGRLLFNVLCFYFKLYSMSKVIFGYNWQ